MRSMLVALSRISMEECTRLEGQHQLFIRLAGAIFVNYILETPGETKERQKDKQGRVNLIANSIR